MADSFRLRLRSIRYKDGRAPLRVLHSKRPDVRQLICKTFDAVMASHSNPAGMAVVVWDAACDSSARFVVSDMSSIPTILLPDFVRNRLLAERIETWTIQALDERQGR